MQLVSPDARVGARGADMGFSSFLALFYYLKKICLSDRHKKQKKLMNAQNVLSVIYFVFFRQSAQTYKLSFGNTSLSLHRLGLLT